jgi:hypothetical protein
MPADILFYFLIPVVNAHDIFLSATVAVQGQKPGSFFARPQIFGDEHICGDGSGGFGLIDHLFPEVVFKFFPLERFRAKRRLGGKFAQKFQEFLSETALPAAEGFSAFSLKDHSGSGCFRAKVHIFNGGINSVRGFRHKLSPFVKAKKISATTSDYSLLPCPGRQEWQRYSLSSLIKGRTTQVAEPVRFEKRL